MYVGDLTGVEVGYFWSRYGYMTFMRKKLSYSKALNPKDFQNKSRQMKSILSKQITQHF